MPRTDFSLTQPELGIAKRTAKEWLYTGACDERALAAVLGEIVHPLHVAEIILVAKRELWVTNATPRDKYREFWRVERTLRHGALDGFMTSRAWMDEVHHSCGLINILDYPQTYEEAARYSYEYRNGTRTATVKPY